MTKEDDSNTRGERRRRSRRRMGVSGRSVRVLQEIIRRRGQRRTTGRNRDRGGR